MRATRRKPALRYVVVFLILCSCAWIIPRLLATAPGARGASVVLMAYETAGLRPEWLRTICERYTSPEYASLIEEIVLVWNNPAALPPADLPSGVKVVRSQENSLNNRWRAAPDVASPIMLAHDNDLVLSEAGIRCLLTVWADHPDRLIGPYARQRVDLDYIVDDLVSRPSPYHFVLPRALVGSSATIANYNAPELARLRDYVDTQAAHCDDLLVNLVVSKQTQQPPLRVALPQASVSDYASVCSPLDRARSSGLADQGSRTQLRTDCMQHFFSSPQFNPEVSSPVSSEIAVCNDDGSAYTLTKRVSLQRWRAMENGSAVDLCPDLALPEIEKDERVDDEGLRYELETYCPPVDRPRTEWLDALIELGNCGAEEDQPLDPALVPSAEHQCGAWCVWDLRQATRAGWRLHPYECWERFEEGHAGSCDQWFWQRPRFNLEKDSLDET